MATSLPQALWGSLWKKNLLLCEGHTISARASTQRTGLCLHKAAAFGVAGWGERNGKHRKRSTQKSFAAKSEGLTLH